MFRTDYCGYNYRNPDKDIIYRPDGSGDYLFLHLTSPMTFYFPAGSENRHNAGYETVERDGLRLVQKSAVSGDCILFTPGHPQYYQAVSSFSNSFVHFTCDPEEIRGLQIPMNTLFHPNDDEAIIDCLRRIQFEYLSKQSRKERMIDLLIMELLISAERSIFSPAPLEEGGGIYSFLSAFRINMLQRCSEEWNIEKICKETHLGRSQLYHYYKTFFFTSPKDDLITARIDKAKHLLTNKELRVSDVAEQCGFTNIYHFNRYFKRELGCTPSQYRM
ncbi:MULTISPECIES: helix-turn-helix transcriptional regulator [unclassified Butyrivibrio]|uniref:helix-turn-helix transcriptional regulator n=1 Tax=unclassified Butyrivibrio TaxID=2639466 RepID=UPI0003B680F6|nr:MULTISPECIES: AraC family transcriptional regulator [unclassified Butyrivibrio]SEL63426.1 Helix-turn-helix domain-containing protein [Butyrivibrio sp. ob235]